MMTLHFALRASLLAASTALLAACGSDAHDHDHEGHDHSEGGHVHDPLFGGTLVELGDHFANLEYKLDAETGELKVWVLDGHATETVQSPTEAATLEVEVGGEEFELQLLPVVSATKGNEVGSSFEFAVTDERLVGVTEFEAEIASIMVKGTEFTEVELGEHDHGEGDHDHDEDGDHDHDHEEGDGHDHDHEEGDGHDHEEGDGHGE